MRRVIVAFLDRPPVVMQQLGFSAATLTYSPLLLAANSFNRSSTSLFGAIAAA